MKIKYTKNAISDVEAIYEYTKNIEKDPKFFLSKIKAEIDILADFPNTGRKGRVVSTMELIIPQTPFIVAYRVKNNEVHVLAIIHNARRWPEVL